MISCIITTYMREVCILERAVNSIVNQTYKDLEIIVVNDCPEDSVLCEDIRCMLKKYPMPIKYIVHEKNLGACSARNTGISAASGEYVAFLDDDDEWVYNKLELQLDKINEKNSALVYCDHIFINEKKQEIIEKPSFEYLIGNNDFEKLLCYNFIGSTSFPLIRKSALDDVGGFNTELKSSQDHEVWLKISRKYTIDYVNVPLVKYYFTEVAITRSIKNREQGYSYLLNEFKDAYSNNPDILHCRYILLSTTYFGMKYFKKGLFYWGKAIGIKPISSRNYLIVSKLFKKLFHK